MSDATWESLGIRVGEKRTWTGEQLRDLGLEPDTEPDSESTPPQSLIITNVTADTITITSSRKR